MRIGFAGAGSMAAAMARGWATTGVEGETLFFCDLDPARARSLAEEVGGTPVGSLGELRDRVDVLVLAVKPSALGEVAAELEGRAPALVSILAATSVARIAEAFPGVPALRLMPNQPVAVGRGVLCYVPPAGMPEPLAGELFDLLGRLGSLVAIDEGQIDAAMAVMSCSPAYVAAFAQALAEGGVEAGLDAELAASLASEAIAGTAELLGVQPPDRVRAAVAPPGGATEAGLDALEEKGFSGAIRAAVSASLERFR